MTEKAYFAKLAKEIGQFKMNSTEYAQAEMQVYRMYKEAGFNLKRAREFNEKCLSLAVKPDSEEFKLPFAQVSKKKV